MARTKQVSKRKRRRIGLPALGAAGVSLVMVGGAAANAPTANVPSLQDTSLRPAITLDEEEIADVSLGTFYVFDKENEFPARPRHKTCGTRRRRLRQVRRLCSSQVRRWRRPLCSSEVRSCSLCSS